ncbi:MAG: polyprenyl synthetase family protein [Caldilineaceae bacterium]
MTFHTNSQHPKERPPSTGGSPAVLQEVAEPVNNPVEKIYSTNLTHTGSGDANGTMHPNKSGNGRVQKSMTVVAEPPADIRLLLAPVRSGLQQVEQKMQSVDGSLFGPLATAFIELIGSGGKRLRPALALMAAEALATQSDADALARTIAIAAAVEMLHTATLVHDDVIDGALLRRGAATLNAKWSQSSTVLAGNYMFARAAHFAAETENVRVIHIFSDTLRIMVNGELRQIFARNNYWQDKESYYERIYAKTASLFAAATESAAVLMGAAPAVIEELKLFGHHLGMAFQIMDDILDFVGDEETLGKPAGSDLRQGTLTLPFFYFVNSHENPAAFVDFVEQQRDLADEEGEEIWSGVVADIVTAVRNSSAIEAARAEAVGFITAAHQNLAALPDNIYKQSMSGLCSFVVQRTY